MTNIRNAKDYFRRGHFEDVSDLERAKDLFKSSIRVVNIELFSFCNRRCDYCPVSKFDRLTSNNYLNRELFTRVIQQLACIKYDEMINLNLFNEPTADRELLIASITAIRNELPKCKIVFSSNGDYLDPAYIADLKNAGTDIVFVTLHAKVGMPYSDLYSMNRFSEFSSRIGLRPQFDNFEHNKIIHAYYLYQNMRIETCTYNIKQGGTNRGGLIDTVAVDGTRTCPCDRVFTDFTISHDGNFFPCCQLFSDAEQHRKLRIGHLDDFKTIFEAYATARYAAWRRVLLTHDHKTGVCATCLEGQAPATETEITEREEIADRLIRAIN